MNNISRPRVSAAVLRHQNTEVLMVRHQRKDKSTYWQLPGGGIELGESPESAVLRELYEETGLTGKILKEAFALSYKFGISKTFLVETESGSNPSLGFDPEETETEHRKLVEVGWKKLAEMSDNPEVIELTKILKKPNQFVQPTP